MQTCKKVSELKVIKYWKEGKQKDRKCTNLTQIN